MKKLAIISLVALSVPFSLSAQGPVRFELREISLTALTTNPFHLQQPTASLTSGQRQAGFLRFSITASDMPWSPGYDHQSELGFFCKFEDAISRRSWFQLDLGLTGN